MNGDQLNMPHLWVVVFIYPNHDPCVLLSAFGFDLKAPTMLRAIVKVQDQADPGWIRVTAEKVGQRGVDAARALAMRR